MLLAAVSLYEALLAAVALSTVLIAVTGWRDRMRRNLKEERDEYQNDNERLRRELERVRLEMHSLHNRTDLTRVIDLVAENGSRVVDALEKHEQRAAARADRQIRVLEKLALAWDIKLRNGDVSH
jgi:predicted RNase H-like nuclease (RuvC/YqgF family)